MIMTPADIDTPSEYLTRPIRTQRDAELDWLTRGVGEEYAVLRVWPELPGCPRAWDEMDVGKTRADIVRNVAEGQYGDLDNILLIRCLKDGRYWDVTEAIKEEAEAFCG